MRAAARAPAAVCADTRLRVPDIRPARAICPACLHMQRALVLGTCLVAATKTRLTDSRAAAAAAGCREPWYKRMLRFGRVGDSGMDVSPRHSHPHPHTRAPPVH